LGRRDLAGSRSIEIPEGEAAMKNSGFTSSLRSTLIPYALAVGACVPALPALAQTGSTVGTVDIPFVFHIDNQEMPAGQYRIDHEASTLLLLRGPSRSGVVLTHPASAKSVSARGFVAFRHIGETYFLEGLWPAGETNGMDCFESPAEKQLLEESKRQVRSVTMLAFNSPARR
jgi:hypothetical protein